MTALPEPPEGHYWRVRYRGGDFCVHLVRRRPWWRGGDVSVNYHFITWLSGELTPKDIAFAARCILDRREMRAREESLLGDYPPKELP